jgi:hypothetical protein
VPVLAAIASYLAVGLFFGVLFVARGAGRVDPVAAATPWRVRVLWLPGAAALWPIMLMKWARSARGRA